MKNNKLWLSVEETQKEIINQVKMEDGTILNSVPSIFRIKKATEKFGAYGKNWGLKEIKHSELHINANLVIGNLSAVFFYTIKGEKISFEISNSISIISWRDGKAQVNFSYKKAIETDTITKALSRLGFNADIYTDGDIADGSTKKDELGIDDLVQFETVGENKDDE